MAVALAAGAGSSLQLTLKAAVAEGVAGNRGRAPLWPLSLQSNSFLYVPGQDSRTTSVTAEGASDLCLILSFWGPALEGGPK